MVAPKKTTESQHNVEFAEGGDTPMFSQQAANADKPGNTGKSPGPAPGAKYAEGGKGKMFGFHGSQPKSPGTTGAR
jgi:hypothetical protein